MQVVKTCKLGLAVVMIAAVVSGCGAAKDHKNERSGGASDSLPTIGATAEAALAFGPGNQPYVKVKDAVVNAYKLCLDRAPEQAGLDAWLTLIDKGTTVNDATASICTSPEATSKPDGYTKANPLKESLDAVRRAYKDCLLRDPEPTGLQTWTLLTARSVGKKTVNEVRESICNSNEGFLQKQYRELLYRKASSTDLQYWEAKLKSGTTRDQIKTYLANSAEAFITTTYLKCQRRFPEPKDMKQHHDNLVAGATREKVQAQICQTK